MCFRCFLNQIYFIHEDTANFQYLYLGYISKVTNPTLGNTKDTRDKNRIMHTFVRCCIPWQRVPPRGRPRSSGGRPAPGHVERAGRGDPRAAQGGVPAVGGAAVGCAAAAAAGTTAAAALAADQRPGEHHARLVVVVAAHDASHLLVREGVVGPCAKEQVCRSPELYFEAGFAMPTYNRAANQTATHFPTTELSSPIRLDGWTKTGKN